MPTWMNSKRIQITKWTQREFKWTAEGNKEDNAGDEEKW
jgi:hypothetical protein